ncbi:MAG: hypothetical protein RR370_02590 [Synergistaceae bacterium]
MCKYCYEGHTEHNCNNGIIFDDITNTYIQMVETGEEVPWGSGYEIVEIEVNYCPMCGRNLLKESIYETILRRRDDCNPCVNGRKIR